MRVYEWGYDSRFMYIVHEFLAGKSFYESLSKLSTIEERVLAILVQQILDVLKYFDGLGVTFGRLDPMHVYFESTDPENLTLKLPNFALVQAIRESRLVPEPAPSVLVCHS